MKIVIFILMAGLALSACHSQKKMMARQAAYASTEPVIVAVQETTVRDTVMVEETPEPAQQEKVVKTQGAELMHYCIIVGSFIYEQNAANLRNSLIRQGFGESSVMRNSEGMYRVCAESSDSHATAWQEVVQLRRRYPQFKDAWLLEVKE